MKRYLFVLLLIFILTAGFTGCVDHHTDGAEDDTFTIIAANFVGYDLARTIVGDQAEITMLLSPGEETHSFDPTPADIIDIQNCDVFLYVGGESDDWVRTILSSMEDSDMTALAFMDHTSLYEEEHKEGMMESRGHDHEHEHGESCEFNHDHDDMDETFEEHDDEITDGDRAHNEYDEHVWTSVRNMIHLAEAVEEVVCEKDPENAEIYHQNAASYMEELDNLDESYHDVVDSAKRKWILFGDRFPFLYMMKEYGLDYYAAFPGCSSETEPNAATIAFLIDRGKEENLSVVLKESLSNDNIALAISGEIGADVMTMYACDNIPAKDFEKGETYLSLMKKNLEVLKEALNG